MFQHLLSPSLSFSLWGVCVWFSSCRFPSTAAVAAATAREQWLIVRTPRIGRSSLSKLFLCRQLTPPNTAQQIKFFSQRRGRVQPASQQPVSELLMRWPLCANDDEIDLLRFLRRLLVLLKTAIEWIPEFNLSPIIIIIIIIMNSSSSSTEV